MERTLVLIHHDALERNLADEILVRFLRAGLRIVARKFVIPTRELAEKQYRATDEQLIGMGNKTLQAMRREQVVEIFGTDNPKKIGEQLLEWTRKFVIGKKLLAIVLEGENAVQKVRQMVGYTDPAKAEKGTIRGDFADDSISRANSEKRKVRNLVHAADSPEATELEIKIWFKPEELLSR